MIKRINKISKTIKRWWLFFIYKPGTKNIYWEKMITSTIVIIALISWAYFNQRRISNLEKKRERLARYCIGEVTSTHFTRSGRDVVEYQFFVGYRRFSNSGSWIGTSWNLPKVRAKYYVQYESDNPQNSVILFKNPVPDTVLAAPDSGWTYMPGYPN